MRKWILAVLLVLNAALVIAESDEFEKNKEKLRKRGFVVIESGSPQPTQVFRTQAGKYIACMNKGRYEVGVWPINYGLFRGRASIHVYCSGTTLLYSNGYV